MPTESVPNTTDSMLPLPSVDYKKEAEQLNSLLASWSTEEDKCKIRRDLRENRKSVTEERQKGTILEDETIIPDRTINSNTKRSKVAYNTYITQSKRALIITDVEAPQISIESLELWFTRGMRYPEWKTPWFELIDSMHVHGGAAMEVIYDPAKPLNVALEYIPRDSLIFPQKTKNIQTCPRILRRYELSSIQLESFAEEYEFNEPQVKELMERFQKSDEFIVIYRVLMKIKGIVHNAWYSKDCNNGWLRDPRPHDIGLIDFNPAELLAPVPTGQLDPMTGQLQTIPLYLSPTWFQPGPTNPITGETLPSPREQNFKPQLLKAYPIIWFPFQVTENQILLECQGRVSLDLHVQEAMTCLMSDTVNGTHRASRFFPSAEEEPGGDGQMKELGQLKHGNVMSRKITVFQPNYPNSIILAAMQALKIGKADEAGQTDFAATARKDANKTATEMELASSQANMVEVSDMDVFSSPVLSTLALCFNVADHQAIFGLCKRPPKPELLIGDYNLQSAGDVEVVKRLEDKNNAKEFFNIVKGTPTAEKILVFLIERFFPDQADAWIAALQEPDKNAVIMQLVEIIKQIPLNELPPEVQLAVRNVVATAQSMVGVDIDTPVSGEPGGAPPGNTTPMPAAEQAN